MARVSTVGARGSKIVNFWKFRAPAPFEYLVVKRILIYSTMNSNSSTSNHTLNIKPCYRLPRSRECTNEPISAMPNRDSMEKVGAGA